MPSIPSLTERLRKIAELVSPCDCFADIGTDHAYLPVYLCAENICKRAIASDINEGPLKRAENTISMYKLNNKISLRLGGGLDTINQNEAQVISIAGMGGLIIANILQEGKNKINSDCLFILQPMTAVTELREYLCKNGWKIERELLAKEADKIYNIITVRFTDKSIPIYNRVELYIGKYLIEHKPDYYNEYLQKKYTKLKNMIDGLVNSDARKSKEKLNYCIELLKDIEKIK